MPPGRVATRSESDSLRGHPSWESRSTWLDGRQALAVAPYRILSTYPPTACGLATFTAALSDALVSNGSTVGVVRVADDARSSNPRVVAELENNVRASVVTAIDQLSAGDVAIVQHEYGLYGGTGGGEVPDGMRWRPVPS